jgi:hypothetical protein
MQTSADGLEQALQQALRTMQRELERIEFLAAVLHGFCAPVPDYEPGFHHLAVPGNALHRFEIGHETASL